MTKVKICGLTGENDIEAVNHLKPDYIGFVFAPKSRRYVDCDRARRLRSQLHPDIQAVGVFVNEAIENILYMCQQEIIDVIQLHGMEEESYIMELKNQTNKPVIKAFAIETPEDIQKANASAADYILLDNGCGGTGESFDWSLLHSVERSFFLAGGLHPENIHKAIRKAKDTRYLYGVDASSGVETNGLKDYIKIERFIQKVRER